MRVTHVYPEGCVPGDPGLTIDSVDFEDDGTVEITYAIGMRYSARDMRRQEALDAVTRALDSYLQKCEQDQQFPASSHGGVTRNGLRRLLDVARQ